MSWYSDTPGISNEFVEGAIEEKSYLNIVPELIVSLAGQ
jgi:hypothetical protein